MSFTKRQAVIVLGMHRSGTSALAGALSLLGARLPVRLMPGGLGNPKGHFEPSHIVGIHDRVLGAAGTTWSGWERIPEAWQRSADRRPFVDMLAAAVLDDFGPTGLFMVKDPRMCRLVPLWLEVLEQLDAEPSFAISFRNPVEVARSLQWRDGLSRPRACLSWLRGVIEAERQTRGQPRAFVPYQALVDDVKGAMERVVASLPIAWPRTIAEISDELRDFVDPALRNHVADAKGIGVREGFGPWLRQALELYERLAQNPEDAAALRGLDELGAVFDAADMAFTPAIRQSARSHAAEVARMEALIQRQQDQAPRHPAVVERSLSELREEIDSLDRALDEQQEEIDRLDRAVIERDAEIASLNRALVERNSVLAERNGEVAELKGGVARAAENVRILQSTISALQQSTSWRVTAPLRSIKRWPGLFRRMAARSFPGSAARLVRAHLLMPLRNRRAVRIIRGSDVFDAGWYRETYPDVAGDGSDPIRHYVAHGAREGRNPSRSFDTLSYLAHNPDVAAAGANPLAHYLEHGVREGRRAARDTVPAEVSFPPAPGIRLEPAADVMAHLMSPTDAPYNDDGYFITRFMHYVWQLRPDLKPLFDLADKRSRLEYCAWFLIDASREYGLSPAAYPDELLIRLAGSGGAVAHKACAFLEAKRRNADVPRAPAPAAEPEIDGANIIGYCRGEFGMGEFNRTAVRALNAAGVPFAAIDCPEVDVHGANDTSIDEWISGIQRFKTNIFNINADILPSLYFKLGEDFFTGHFNIGYWAWELPQCPPEFDIALGMVDEVWALSDFTADSFRTRSPVPVFSMPLAVSAPVLKGQYSKSYFGIGEDDFLFLYTFDGASYLGRKNPIAAVRAFRLAFPRGTEKVRLLLKTMNIPAVSPLWDAVLAEAKADPRIEILNRRISRDEVVGLSTVCDAVVSLHRSEGYGLTVAEAMLLGKPVVVTNWSGTRNFAREDTACVVDYTLVPVPAGQYPFWQHQVWAEPDVGHAASLMRRLVEDEAYRRTMARAGQTFVSENLNAKVVGARYAARLEQIRKSGFKNAGIDRARERPSAGEADDALAGSIDRPASGALVARAETIEISGWCASQAGISAVEVFCDGVPVGPAHHGGLRSDVGNAYPSMADAAHAGFSCLLETRHMAAGPHRLRVVASSRSGREREFFRDFSLGEATVYETWLAANAPPDADRAAPAGRAAAVAAPPLVTLVLRPGQPADHAGIAATLRSVADQTYRNFEILLVTPEDGPRDVVAFGAAEIADRIRVVRAGEQGVWKDAALQARGDFVAVLDAGDLLDPRALSAVAENVTRNSTIDFVYADEDRLVDGARAAPRFKPSYSPIFLESHNYVGRPWFARRDLLGAAIDATGAAEAGSEHALVRELGRAARAVGHVPMVLLSRPASGPHQAGPAPVPPAPAADTAWPRVSIIIPTCLKDRAVVAKCLAGLAERTAYPHIETVVVINNVSDVRAAREFLAQWPVRVLAWDGPYSWAGINNFAARHADGELLLFLNDDIEPLASDWLARMVRLGRRDPVGATGALLRYPNGTIQHAGITVSSRTECGRHLFRYRTGREPALGGIAGYDRECSAVTGACLLTRRQCFDEIGGFDEDMRLVANDIDYCLRLAERGYATVMAGQAELTHHEGLSRGAAPESEDVERFWARWRPRLTADDPFTNPNLDPQRDDWAVDPGARATLAARARRKPDNVVDSEARELRHSAGALTAARLSVGRSD